jgi:intracellular septation protein A
MSEPAAASPLDGPVDPKAIIRQAGPRLVRDGFGPLLAFFIGWKLIGLTAGVLIAVAFGVSVYVIERRAGRPAALVRVALAIVCIRAAVGLGSGSASVYLAVEVGVDVLLGTVVLGSLAAGRPITAWIASDVFPFTPEMRESGTFQEAMRTICAVWGTYFLVRAALRLTALLTLSTDNYVLVLAISDAPFLIGLLAWSVHNTLGAFRSSEQWAHLLTAEEAADPAGP